MLGNREATATIAVKDVKKAGEFYGKKLGLEEVKTGEEGVLAYKSGKSSVLVYESEFAGTNKATAATWMVEDAAKEVEDLKSKGIAFEHYDLPGTEHQGDLHVAGKMKAAWFKDPDGNILGVVEG